LARGRVCIERSFDCGLTVEFHMQDQSMYELFSFASGPFSKGERQMKIFLWIIGIIFLIGLLVVTGFFKLIF
jgi:hypothetical protein